RQAGLVAGPRGAGPAPRPPVPVCCCDRRRAARRRLGRLEEVGRAGGGEGDAGRPWRRNARGLADEHWLWAGAALTQSLRARRVVAMSPRALSGGVALRV